MRLWSSDEASFEALLEVEDGEEWESLRRKEDIGGDGFKGKKAVDGRACEGPDEQSVLVCGISGVTNSSTVMLVTG